jgi:predicted Zn-dependent protease
MAERAPDDAEVRRTLGHVLMEKDQFAAAQAEFAAALQKKPDDVDAKLGLARAFIKLERAEEALVPLADLAARLPDQAIVWSEWGAALAKLGKFDGPEGALAKLDKALELKPELASAHIRKVGALAQAKQCKQAKEALKQFTARKPKPEALEQARTASAAASSHEDPRTVTAAHPLRWPGCAAGSWPSPRALRP